MRTVGTVRTMRTVGTVRTSTSPRSPKSPRSPTSPTPTAPKILLPHGGYRKLLTYRKSDLIYRGTRIFVRRFLPRHGDRTVDQMVQAARSGKQNIVEGSEAAATNKESELNLTNVAKASLYSQLNAAKDSEELDKIAKALHNQIRRTAFGIAKRKDWA